MTVPIGLLVFFHILFSLDTPLSSILHLWDWKQKYFVASMNFIHNFGSTFPKRRRTSSKSFLQWTCVLEWQQRRHFNIHGYVCHSAHKITALSRWECHCSCFKVPPLILILYNYLECNIQVNRVLSLPIFCLFWILCLQLALHGDVLAPRRLEDSIIELRKFNARRRLKASCNAVCKSALYLVFLSALF